jgi:ribosomal protein S18 acetylase RimI-like enzyme
MTTDATVNAITVRRATHEDFPAVAELMQGFMTLHHRWHPDLFRTSLLGFTAAIFQGWLTRKNELHLAAEVEGGGVLGYAGASRFEGRDNDFIWQRRGVYISFIVVEPSRRRTGIGRALFRAIEAWGTEFEAEYIGLNVNPHNEAARAFYAALGYDMSSEYRVKTLRRIARVTPGREN